MTTSKSENSVLHHSKVKLELTDNLIGIVGLGTYHGWFNPEKMIDSYMIAQDIEEGYLPRDWTVDTYWEKFDNALYTDALIKMVNDNLHWLTSELNHLLSTYHTRDSEPFISIDCVGIDSPRYYNYRDDHFNLDVMVNYGAYKQSIWNFVNEHSDFMPFLKDNYTSCDGFISFTANNYEDWERGFNQDNTQDIGSALSFIINHHLDFDFVDHCLQNNELYYTNFIKD